MIPMAFLPGLSINWRGEINKIYLLIRTGEFRLEQSILKNIHSPEDVKALSNKELPLLCKEIRQTLIHAVHNNGGHMASNLGIVELTVALHRVFSTPEDKLLFDVGHQCYPHKLLTGRYDCFATLRQFNGISGFPLTSESPHDAFDMGHASTSISAALGMARARDLQGKDYSVVAVIGDGALTGGMGYEALNDAASLPSNFIVILNDNKMSIGSNVGGMHIYLSKLRTSTRYRRFKRRFKKVLGAVPFLGAGMVRVAGGIKDAIKYTFLNPVFFEELGFTYIGPIDGHDINAMVDVLEHVRQLKEPVFLHIITQKGMGYHPAELEPEKYHGVSPFVVEHTGNGESCSAIFGKELLQLAAQDSRIVAITAAMTAGTGLSDFASRFPNRFFDVGIAEEHAMTMAAGMAQEGLKPFLAIYSTFLQRAIDQLLMDVCGQNLPVTVCIDRAGIVGEDGKTHQGIYDLPLLLTMPNLTIWQPATQKELIRMLQKAKDFKSPLAIRYPRGVLPMEFAGYDDPEDIFKAQELFPASSVTVIALGKMVKVALTAVLKAHEAGYSTGLYNLRSIKPIDREMIARLNNSTNCIIVVEDGSVCGGAGQMLQTLLAPGIETVFIGIHDTFVPHGETSVLFQTYGMDETAIFTEIVARETKVHDKR